MTSSALQRQVKAALDSLSVPVSKDYSEFDGIFPRICYREISNVPALHADNREVFARVVFQVTIITVDDDYEALESAVENIMLNLGFMRSDSQDIIEDDIFNRVLRFSRALFVR